MISLTDLDLLEALTNALRDLPKSDPLHSQPSIGRKIRALPNPEQSVKAEFHLDHLPAVFRHEAVYHQDLFARINQGVEHEIAEQKASILNVGTQATNAIEAPRRL